MSEYTTTEEQPSLIEKGAREIPPLALEAGAMFVTALAMKDAHPHDRMLMMTLIGTTASLISLRTKEGRGLVNGSFTEMAKTGILGVATAYAVDNPAVAMPAIESVGTTAMSTIQEHGGNFVAGMVMTAGLAVAGWGGVRATEAAIDLASRKVEQAKHSARETSKRTMSGIADRLQGTANKLHAKADQDKLIQGEPINPSANDYNWDNFEPPQSTHLPRINIKRS